MKPRWLSLATKMPWPVPRTSRMLLRSQMLLVLPCTVMALAAPVAAMVLFSTRGVLLENEAPLTSTPGPALASMRLLCTQPS